MIDSMQRALIFKDIRGITSNKRLFSVLLIVPLVLALMLPTIFVLTVTFVPEESSDFQELLNLLPDELLSGDPGAAIIRLILNNIMPVFFLLIPIMASSVMAASSFVGEKEKRTLETLLYTPLSLVKIFRAKILASLLLSMAVTFLSFTAMVVVLELELMLTMGIFVMPDVSWIVLMLLVCPAVSLIAITLIVRGSAKARTIEESQQRSVFLILPVIMLMVGQFAGLFLINPWVLLAMGIALAVISLFTLKSSASRFTYENLLR